MEDSLKRLQTDHIDIYQSHRDDARPQWRNNGGLCISLINQGKIKAIGASNFTGDRLSEALRVSDRYGYPSYQSLQPRYNLYDRQEFEALLEPLCREAGMGVISYYSLASGFLTGKYRSSSDLSKSARGTIAALYMNAADFGSLMHLTALQISIK